MNYTWDWQVFLRDTGAGQIYLEWLMSAWGWTLAVASIGLIVALVIGSLAGILRTVPGVWLSTLGTAWTELFRNIPLLVQVFLWYYVVPALIPPIGALPSFLLVAIALGLYTSARISEQIKAGILSLPGGQRHAGLAMGFTQIQTYRYVLLPVAFRIVIPPLTSESMTIVKNSSVAFVAGVAELTMFAMQVQEETSQGIEVYLVVTSLYFVSAYAINRTMLLVENRMRIPGTVGAGQ
ncbi:MAG: amino acid ABC transporter permease [Pseudomonas sp.]|uniref:amino acid ABC transporter permease n=1 Tax=Pseudomonas sp. TaxID=306 RepID=UPI003D13DC99